MGFGSRETVLYGTAGQDLGAVRLPPLAQDLGWITLWG